MSAGKNLQEMENPVTRGAKAGESMDSSAKSGYVPGHAQVDDLGGPTPENYKPDDDSAKLKEPTLSHVRNVVNAKAKAAEGMDASKKNTYGEEAETEEEIVDEATIEEEEVTEEDVNIEEDVAALFSGEELSEDFQEKARIIFEATVKAKVSEVREQLEEAYAARIVEEVEEIKEELVTRVDAYLEYVSEEWIKENELQIEHGLKTEMTESFLQGMRGLFEDHYVNIPDDKYDVVEMMVDKLDDMEAKLNEQIEKNISLNQRLGESVADHILKDVSEGLAVTQKEKLASLAESVEFESEESYREKLANLRESYFSTEKAAKQEKTETLTEGMETVPAPATGRMNAYLRALGN